MKCPKCNYDNPDTQKFCGECGLQLDSADSMPAYHTKTMETPVEELTRGTLFSDRYEIIEELGRGGMGKVYRVEDKKTKEELALKLIKPEISADKKTIERFSNELSLAHKISHRNVCRMFHLGEEKGSHYITMEFVPGEDLRSLIRRIGQLPVGKSISIAKQICDGLAEAHNLGIVHRDLKPSNIMIDADGNARIMDFGIARSIEGKGLTGAGVMIGTPEYMSPEQVEAKEVDQRSDIYSLGIIMYEMLTGRLPFEADTPFAVGVKHKSEIPKNPKEFNPQIPDDLCNVILKCLEKEKEGRYQKAGDLSSELEKIEQGLPTTDRVVPKKKTLTSKEIKVQFSLKKIFIPAFILITIAVIGLIIWSPWTKRIPLASTSDKPSLAVMYFENRTSFENLDKLLVDMLIRNLSRYEALEVISSQRLFDILREMDKHNIEVIDKKIATEVAINAGVPSMLLGSISQIGKKMIIITNLTDVRTGAILDSTQVECTEIEDEISEIVAQLTADVISQMNLSSDQGKQESKIANLATESLEAYNHYLKGLENLWRWGFRQAEVNFQMATEIDPNFAIAHAWKAWSETNFGIGLFSPWVDTTPFKETMTRAQEVSATATERERLIIDIGMALFDLDFERALNACQSLEESYPKEKLGSFFSGLTFYVKADWKNSKTALEKTLELDPGDALAYNFLAYVSACLGDKDAAISAVKTYIALQPDIGNPFHSAWEVHAQLGLFDDASKYIEDGLKFNPEYYSSYFWKGISFLLKGDAEKARGEFRTYEKYYPDSFRRHSRDRSLSYIIEGKFSKAEEENRIALDLAQSQEDLRTQLSIHRDLGRILSFQNKHDDALNELKEAEGLALELYPEDYNPRLILIQFLIGRTLIDKGDNTAAKEQADAMLNLIEQGNYNLLHRNYYHLLLGALFTAQKEATAAWAEFDQILGSFKMSSPLYQKFVADLHEIEGNHQRAIESLRNSLERWILIDIATRDYLSFFHIRSKLNYLIAGKYERKGDTAKAIEHYEKFLDLWKDADSGIAEVEDARERLAGLKIH